MNTSGEASCTGERTGGGGGEIGGRGGKEGRVSEAGDRRLCDILSEEEYCSNKPTTQAATLSSAAVRSSRLAAL